MADEIPIRRDAAEQPPARSSYVFESIVIPVSVLIWLFVLLQMLFVVPRFQKLYGDFRMRVPMNTQLIMDHAWWLAAIVMLASFLLCVPVRSRWGWLILLLGVPKIANLSIFLNLWVPYLRVLQMLEGRG